MESKTTKTTSSTSGEVCAKIYVYGSDGAFLKELSNLSTEYRKKSEGCSPLDAFERAFRDLASRLSLPSAHVSTYRVMADGWSEARMVTVRYRTYLTVVAE
jgi:hypothetical protein